MDMKKNLDKLMEEAKKMQEKMQLAQKALAEEIVEGKAGAGLVTVEMNGRHDVTKVAINQNLMEDDKEILEDLIAAAVNDAVRKIEKVSREKIKELTSDLKIPTDFKLPEEEDKE